MGVFRHRDLHVVGDHARRPADSSCRVGRNLSAGDAVTLTRSERAGAGAFAAAGATATGYDTLGRVTGITTTSGAGGTLATYAYAYDAADWMTSETVDGVARSYGYDNADQLTADGGAAVAYDPAGNRTSGGGTVGTGNRLTTDGTWAYTYDADGRVTKRSLGAAAETWVYAYDHAGRVTQATRSATDGGPATLAVGYAYDAFGNRAERTSTAGGATATERFAYDGWDTAKPGAVGTEAFDAWADLDGANAVTARRLFGGGFDQPLARLAPAGGAAAWYGADVRGSVRAVFDAAGAVTGARDYAGFGAVVSASGAGLDRYAYTGREWDAGLGLQYSRARLYDPAAGRFLAEDPKGFGGGDANLHRYVGNAPTTRTDPSGLQPPAYGGGPDNDYRHGALGPAAEPFLKLPTPEEQEREAAEFDARLRAGDKPLVDANGAVVWVPRRPAWVRPAPPTAGSRVAAAVVREVDRAVDRARYVDMVVLRTGPDGRARFETVRIDQFAPVVHAYAYLTDPLPGDPETLAGRAMPVVGSSRMAAAALADGRYVRAGVYGALAVADVFLVKAAVQGGLRLLGRAAASCEVAGTAQLTTGARLPVPAAKAPGAVRRSELGNALSDLGTNPLGRNLNHLDEFGPGAGFSGVLDVESGKFLAYASGETKLANGGVPRNLVKQLGGHADVNAALSQVLGNTSRNRLGFSATLDDAGNFGVRFNSTTINEANPTILNRTVPEGMRQQILDAITKSTGRKAYSAQ